MSLNSSTTFDHDPEDNKKAGKGANRARSSTYEASQNKVVEELGGDGSTGSFIEEEQNKKGYR